jgi:hypothetical protein
VPWNSQFLLRRKGMKIRVGCPELGPEPMKKYEKKRRNLLQKHTLAIVPNRQK